MRRPRPSVATNPPPWRLFLDTGVIVEGITQPWGAAKAVLILAAERDRYTVVLAETVRAELDRFLALQAERLTADAHDRLISHVRGWFRRVRLERRPPPSAADCAAAVTLLLPALRHPNDLPSVVTALQARPDWVISANPDHWNPELGRRTGLRIVTPNEFLRLLAPQVNG